MKTSLRRTLSVLLALAMLMGVISVQAFGADTALYYGDVNGDGKVNSLDAAMVLRYDAGLTTLNDMQLTLADTNADGKVNSLDAAMVLRYDVGLIKDFPAGEVYEQKAPTEGLVYELSYDETYYIVYGIGTATDTDIVIASEYKGLPVKEIYGTEMNGGAFSRCTSLTSITIPDSVTYIGEYAFAFSTSLTSITIPDSVTYIGWWAFSGCTSLTSITIPDSVTSIRGGVFWDCTSLTSITIPDSVTLIASNAFSGCSSLTSINVDADNPTYHSKGNCIIETVTKTLIAGCGSSIIPNDGSVTSIGYHAFSDRTSLTNITIPDSVTYIDVGAFSGCTNLTSVVFENTTGWRTHSQSGTSDGVDVTDPTANATNLVSKYDSDCWKRSA